MPKHSRAILALVITVATLFFSGCQLHKETTRGVDKNLQVDQRSGAKTPTVEMVTPTPGQVIPVLSPEQQRWLSAPREERIPRFALADERARMFAMGDKPVAMLFRWREIAGGSNGELTLHEHLADSTVTADTGYVRILNQDATSIAVTNLKISTKYSWVLRVKNGAGGTCATAAGHFTTEAAAPRLLSVDGVPNFRDFGGRIGLGGRRIKQGLIYRSAGLNDNAKMNFGSFKITPGKNRLNQPMIEYLTKGLGIKTDLDLRTIAECYGMTGSPIGPGVQWIHNSSNLYSGLATQQGRDAFAKSFRLMLDTNSYPILFHCIAGQDRTGSLGCILGGLLGVAEDELYLDWEASGFANQDTAFNYQARFLQLIKVFDAYPGDALNQRIENYVLSAGFTRDDINKFRSIMLE